MNDWVTEAALYVEFAGADALTVHTPTPVVLPVVPLIVHGPDGVKLTGRLAEDDALNENVLPYCTSCNGAKLIVCDNVLEPCARMANVPDTALAALKPVLPGCDAVTVQLPVLLRFTVAEETLLVIDWLPMEHVPVALKFTCNPFGMPADMAVAVTVSGVVESVTELGTGPREMLWFTVSTAGGDGALDRCPPVGS